ncbi:MULTISPECIES: beta-ketoacyl-ACP synthase III [Streptomycetaceae]|uniref:Beta-ketoacyl-[acyl-carrier-protein] synthase III n=1 Tax=Streptantibioticus cattleyicolor (strain ATCC 35852 / DSM 46488 / JCM 4925 / NBRC 14057 / NRRL 8057) TaxID=1003195 RepID=F8K4B3_STREN|nr:beta-ketoacyl-ACP synthase III [Streptantibioticus cattleyicolor]AEW93867.1 3-oxoacyl-(acyl carrier protein) synthase III [Streptantibioticus cattleyicolor NRRL 8057 = DSM 46488]MYS58550.1 beta-ketoacyl-ACP synthase III [Streptomyces sp. SID5468]CCB74215.1 beta-ketoacyl-acyl carrier protein synthase III [Streptantibioticus cattleyicolor NRRL 8057 = DSM 46488]
MPGTRIAALGHYQPERVLTNDDLAAMVETDDEWIRTRTGIVTRHIAGSESVTDMAAAAAGKALAAAGLDPADIGLVTVATCSAIDRCPSTAAQVAGRLGIPGAVAFDLNNACAGFCTALATADHAVRAGAARHALVIGAEKMSDVTDWTDRRTCVILGDGAGAAVVSAADEAGIGPVVWGSDPTRADAVRLVDDWHPKFAQEGQTVFRWATTELVPLVREACERAGLAPADLGAVVTHQANLRIVEALVRRLDLPEHVVVARDVTESGNTSAASVPLALSKLAERGELPSGAPALLFAFGGGLSWAGQVVRCP